MLLRVPWSYSSKLSQYRFPLNVFSDTLSIIFAAIPSFIFNFSCILVSFYRTSQFGFSINKYFVVVSADLFSSFSY
ncbi:hypothetical protein ACE6H2_016734 [Prunus campanulata]